jgi:hypothetical protein
MKYYSAIKKNEILSFSAKWMELENIMLSEIIQSQKDKFPVFSLTCGSFKRLCECRIVITRIWEERRRRNKGRLDNKYPNTFR